MFRPDRLILRPSYPLAGLVVAAHLLGMLATLTNALPLSLRLLLLGTVVWQSFYLLRRYVFLNHPDSIREIRWTEHSWSVRLSEDAEFVDVEPAKGCRVYGWITLLRFRRLAPAAGGRSSVLSAWLLGERRSARAIRRLRVQLIQSCSSQN